MTPLVPLLSPSQKAYLSVLAYTLLQNAKYERALVVLLVLKRLYPQDPLIPLSRAYAYLKLKAHKAAYEEAEIAERLYPKGPRQIFASLMKSKALWDLGQQEEARKILMSFVGDRKKTTPSSYSSLAEAPAAS